MKPAEEVLRAALARPRDGLVMVTTSAPTTRDPAVVMDALGPVDACLLHAPGEDPVAGVGVAAAVVGRGASRFDDVQARAAEVFERCEQLGEVSAPAPRFFGGFSFSPGAADADPWTGFGDARFVLPRWTYGLGAKGAWLRVTLAPDDSVEEVWSERQRILLAIRSATVREPRWRHVSERGSESFESYRARVEAIIAAIADGSAEKIVAARRVRLQSDAALDPTSALMLLARRYPGCARFAFRIDGTTFLGATPESLISRKGDRVKTVALAGTVPRGRADELLTSSKEAREHALVVQAIADALAPHVALAPIAPRPLVRELPNVLHMQTPIEGTLRQDAHVLTLAAALHPTPAVGGVPRERALAWIAEAEDARGWYASPVGSFDAEGQGDLFVALRSGLVRDTVAYAYAGGGIVAGSEPAAEHRETEMKLRPFVEALAGEVHEPVALSPRAAPVQLR